VCVDSLPLPPFQSLSRKYFLADCCVGTGVAASQFEAFLMLVAQSSSGWRSIHRKLLLVRKVFVGSGMLHGTAATQNLFSSHFQESFFVQFLAVE
jgi:hypothetical protein